VFFVFLFLSSNVLVYGQDAYEPVSIEIAVSDDFIVLRMENVGLENMTGIPIAEKLGGNITDILFSSYLCVNSSVEIYRPKSETMSSVTTLYLEYNTTTMDYFPVGDSRLVEISLGLPGDEYVASQYDFTLYTVNLHHILYYNLPVDANITIDYEDLNLTPYPPLIDEEDINGSERLYFYGSRITQTYKVFTHPIDQSTNNLLDQIHALENTVDTYADEIAEINTNMNQLASSMQNLVSEYNSYKIEMHSTKSEREKNEQLIQFYSKDAERLGALFVIAVILIPIAYLQGKKTPNTTTGLSHKNTLKQ